MAAVCLSNVTKRFGAVTALDQVSLDLAHGQVLAVVGPSGSGKTTLLRVIAGLDLPTSGEVSIAGTQVNGIPPHQRDVAMAFQGYPLYPNKTVRKNLAFPLLVRKTPKPEIAAAVAEISQWLGIADLLDRMPDALSGGQRQRVALGKALIRRPAVLLLDEPLSSVDGPLRLDLRMRIKARLSQAKTTCVYVTHDLAEAQAVADRVCVLGSGRVLQFGPVKEVLPGSS